MEASDITNEGTECAVVIDLFDLFGTAALPSTFTYRVNDVDSGTELKAPSTLTPATEITVPLGSDVVGIIDTTKAMETREVTMIAAYDVNKAATASFKFRVRNLRFFPFG